VLTRMPGRITGGRHYNTQLPRGMMRLFSCWMHSLRMLTLRPLISLDGLIRYFTLRLRPVTDRRSDAVRLATTRHSALIHLLINSWFSETKKISYTRDGEKETYSAEIDSVHYAGLLKRELPYCNIPEFLEVKVDDIACQISVAWKTVRWGHCICVKNIVDLILSWVSIPVYVKSSRGTMPCALSACPVPCAYRHALCPTGMPVAISASPTEDLSIHATDISKLQISLTDMSREGSGM